RRRWPLAVLLATFGDAPFLGLGPAPHLLLGGGFHFRLQLGLGLADPLKPLMLVGHPIRQLIAALVAVELVLLRIGGLGGFKPTADLGRKFRFPFLHAIITHRLVLGRVRLDLGAVKRHMPSFTKPAFSASCNTCTNRAASALRCRRRNSEIVRKSGGSPATIIMKSARSTAAFA